MTVFAKLEKLRPNADQAPGNFAAGAMNLVLAMPLESLFQRGLQRHLVPVVPEFVHGVLHSQVEWAGVMAIPEL